MARPWRVRYVGAKYHVTVRGNARQVVFHYPEDYSRFLSQLDEALDRDAVILYAYALMRNHFHLFVETPHGNIDRFMQRLNTSYSMYHRYKRSKPGHCFQGRYDAKVVGGDAYIAALSRYIHLNPVKISKFKNRPGEECIAELARFRWSSYRGYVQQKHAEERIDYRWLALMGCATAGANRRRYREYVESFVNQDDAEFVAAQTMSRYAIGDERFVEQVESDVNDVREDKGVYGDITWPVGTCVPLARVAEVVAQTFGLEQSELAGRRYAARLAKKVAVELGCRHGGLSQRQVGEYFGYRGNGSVIKQRQRLSAQLAADRKLQRRLKLLEKELKNG